MTDAFYKDLKIVEDNLFEHTYIEKFINTYPITTILNNIVKNSNSKNRIILQDLLRKIIQTPYFKDLLLLYKDTDKQKLTIFKNFLKSNKCQLFFRCIEDNADYVYQLIKTDNQCIDLLFALMCHEHGLKIMRMWNKLFKDKTKLQNLLNKEIAIKFRQGIQNQDSVAAMRFVELSVNASTYHKQIFLYMQQNGILKKALQIYSTQDILLKLNIGQIIQLFGNSLWTIQYLKNNSIWSLILKEAFDENTEPYVRKNLILLLSKMHAFNSFVLTPQVSKNIGIYLMTILKSKNVEDNEGALSIISNLNTTLQGVNIFLSNKTLLQAYIFMSLSTRDTIKRKFINTISSLALKNNKANSLIINFINCIGDASLIKIMNIKDNYVNTQGLPNFSKWFYSYLSLPFEQLQLQCVLLYKGISLDNLELLDYKQICVQLFTHSNAISYLKSKGIRKDIILAKNQLINQIIKRGESIWKGHQLQHFSGLLKVQLTKKSDNQMEYMVEAK